MLRVIFFAVKRAKLVQVLGIKAVFYFIRVAFVVRLSAGVYQVE